MLEKCDILEAVRVLEVVKYLSDIGVYDRVCSGYSELNGGDYYEILQNALCEIAPIFNTFQITQNDDGKWVEVPDDEAGYVDYWNDVGLFSSPEMQEYYALCSLYEINHSCCEEENPFAVKAERHYVACLKCTNGYFSASYNEDRHPRCLWIEWNEETYYPELELLICIHDTLQYYSENIAALRLELLITGLPCLPRLPEKGLSYA